MGYRKWHIQQRREEKRISQTIRNGDAWMRAYAEDRGTTAQNRPHQMAPGGVYFRRLNRMCDSFGCIVTSF